MVTKPSQTAAKQCVRIDHISFLVKVVYLSLNRTLDQAMAPLDLTAMQWRPLSLIGLGRADTAAELAGLMGIDTGAITRTLDRLQAKGLLRRTRSQQDRRVVRLELTDSGHEKAQQIPRYVAKIQDQYLSGFSTEETAQLRQMLMRMLENAPDDIPLMRLLPPMGTP